LTLLNALPPVRGKYIENAPLGDITWLRVGGPAEVMFLPADEADLARFLAETPDEIPVTVLGAGSNVLVRDGGVKGVVVRLSAAFGKVEAISDTQLRAGAATLDKKVAQTAARAGIGGLEFFVGIPGAIGGALRMNAGCYDRETKDVLVSAVALDRAGRRIMVEPAELGYAYRHSDAPGDWIFTEAIFEGEAGDPAEITAKMGEISARRESTQPIRERTSGSTFKNPDPPGTPNQRKAWELIDQAGWRGKKIGGACFSELHANFLINDGTATAADLEAVVEGARADIRAATGIDLHWEVKRLGDAK
tara:strand:- start:455 stop:1372 length:918 start_codon:yes stop_codon:yes gene_type:complete